MSKVSCPISKSVQVIDGAQAMNNIIINFQSKEFFFKLVYVIILFMTYIYTP
jgi:hypothetical protein